MARKRISRPPIERWADWQGTEVAGIIADIRPGPPGTKGRLIDISTAEGIKTFGLASVLETLLGQAPHGSRVWITFVGEKRGKSGNEFFDFQVDLDLPDEDGRGETAAEAPEPVAASVPAEDDELPF